MLVTDANSRATSRSGCNHAEFLVLEPIRLRRIGQRMNSNTVRANERRQPFMDAAGEEVDAVAARTQNHALMPMTRLVACTRSPAARAKRTLSPNFRSHETPM